MDILDIPQKQLSLLREEKEQAAETILNGQLDTLEKYKYWCGYLNAVLKIEMGLLDLIKKSQQEDDDTDK